jgi:hypothetical protein
MSASALIAVRGGREWGPSSTVRAWLSSFDMIRQTEYLFGLILAHSDAVSMQKTGSHALAIFSRTV